MLRRAMKDYKAAPEAITFSWGTTKREALVSYGETDSWRAWEATRTE